MIDKNIIANLTCLNTNPIEHFINDPILLSCGHGLCKSCIPANHAIKCKVCGEINEHSLDELHKAPIINVLITQNVNELAEIVYEKFVKWFDKLKEFVSTYDNNIYSQIDFAKEEVSLRIESLKSELDVVGSRLKDKLDSYKDDYRQWKIINDSYFKKFQENTFKMELDLLKNNITKHVSLNKEYLYSCQNRVKELTEIHSQLNKIQPKIRFESKKLTLASKNVIGNIVQNFSNIEFNIRLRSGEYDVYTIPSNCTIYGELVALPNGTIAVCTDTKGIMVLDSEFKKIKCIDKINGEKFRSCILDTNNVDAIYILDDQKEVFYKTNMQFEYLCHSDPFCGIFYASLTHHDGFLYVCNQTDQNIVKLNATNLKYEQKFQLNIIPNSIRIMNNTACITSSDGIFFFNVQNFEIICNYSNRNGTFGKINCNFYLYDIMNKAFHCYDDQGNESTILVEKNHDYLVHAISSIGFFENKIILIDGTNKIYAI